MSKQVNSLVIAGGGTAGWMAAAALAKLVARPLSITLIESEDIGTVGVGEATIPSILTINRMLKIPEPDFIKLTNGTFKLGIKFENWRRQGESYIHSFGDTGRGSWAAGFHHFWLTGKEAGIGYKYGDYCAELKAAEEEKFAITSQHPLNYAYHLDAAKYAQYLRSMAEAHGVKRVEGKITSVATDEDGYITSLDINDGADQIDGDFFIDCTGFRALLSGDALGVAYDDWSHWLPANRAWAVQSKLNEPPKPYTRSIAHTVGWQWRIPLQHRAGNGLVYSSEFMREDDARELLINNVDDQLLTEPRPVRFTTGQRAKYWEKNCLALGLASGFIEPLESTSIHMIQNGITWFLLMFPDCVIEQSTINEYNHRIRTEVEYIRDFIVLHYTVNERYGEPFWDYCRNMSLPDTLNHRIDLFQKTGRIFQAQDDIFTENSWVQVLLGQGITPASVHNIAQAIPPKELDAFLSDIRNEVTQAISRLPSHGDYIQQLIRHARQ